MRTTGIRGAWCASDWRLWLLSIIHFSDLHGVLSVVWFFFTAWGIPRSRVDKRTEAVLVARSGQGGPAENPPGCCVATRVIRAFLYCRSFRSVSATPHVMILF